jgi:hypothetical protein
VWTGPIIVAGRKLGWPNSSVGMAFDDGSETFYRHERRAKKAQQRREGVEPEDLVGRMWCAAGSRHPVPKPMRLYKGRFVCGSNASVCNLTVARVHLVVPTEPRLPDRIVVSGRPGPGPLSLDRLRERLTFEWDG